ncbi:Ig-like domain-containing protein [Sporocytophaga myxococcoides]|uniref:Ig-like domain-containing protein n=1 Tax=Sporocytophaga myxococcoides TaxID=153721 RepID=UPI00041F52B8|nr:Ig-like domain-containing protein [Sporocytophaga myxococcoides]
MSVLLSFFVFTSIHAQDITAPPVNIGSVDDFYNAVHLSENQIKTRKIKKCTIPVTKDSVSAQINIKKTVDGEEVIIGEVQDKEASSVTFSIADGKLNGYVVIPSDRKAFRYFSQKGNVFVEEEDINKVICIDFNKSLNAEKRALPVQAPPSGSAVYNLQSLAGAVAVAYLDFDGQVVTGTRWNGGNTINALPGNFSETEVTNIWKMISEDYRAFNINITTNEAVFNAAPKGRRIRCIFTPTNTASPGAGGVAYVNSFRWTDDTPCWVFNSGTKGGGEAGSHEIGHTLGLSHDGRTSPKEDYYSGQGIWAPIMGVGYSKGLVQWSRGEYANANQTQDDITIISGTGNGFGFRTDEAGNTNATAKALFVSQSGVVAEAQNYGIISQRTDVDIYSFTTSGGTVTLTINPAPSYPNLDIVATLKNASGTTLATSNPTASAPSSQTGPTAINGLYASFNINLSAGTYYLNIDGTGQGDPLTTGYSDYSSLGEYFISGTIPMSQVNQKPVVKITSPLNNAVFIAPASINATAVATDADGTISEVSFVGIGSSVSDVTSPYSASWNNIAAGTYKIVANVKDNNGGVGTDTVTVTVVPAVNQNPVVKITSPTNNAVFTAPANISVTATATDADGAISEVSFVGVGSSVSDVTSPYSASWTNVAAGTYKIVANAKDNNGGVGTDTVTVTVVPAINQRPVVKITSPVNNAVFTAPATISVTATATDADGTISEVSFVGVGSSVSDVTSPYSASWTNVAAGTYKVVANVKDNNGGVGTDTVTVTVVPAVNQKPVVKITSPANNAVFTAPANISVAATATDADGTISEVSFVGAGASVLDVTSPYSASWANVAAGIYKIVANVKDNNGGVGTDTVTVTVVPAVNQNPSVSITSPLNNASFNAPANVTITANASDADGTISGVAFYNGSLLLGSDNTAPYTFTITGAAAGTYSLTAVATDNLGGKTTSSIVSVKVENILTTGINGPSCLVAGQRYLFVLSPEATFTNISWWTNAQATIEVDPLDKSKVYITYSANISSVSISAGVNYSVSPWYKQYDKILKVGGCPSAAIEEAAFSALSAKSEESLASVQEEILLSLKLYDFQGKEIAYNGELTLDFNKISEYLEDGAYIVYGVTNQKVIKKKIVVQR